MTIFKSTEDKILDELDRLEPVLHNESGYEYLRRLTITPVDLKSVPFKKSPNQSKREDGEYIRGIVLHHTGPGTFNGVVKWLCNPKAKASANYVISTKGEIKQLVKNTRVAWHAGKSKAVLDGKMRYSLNECTIGIELVNIGLMEKVGDKYFYELGRKTVEWTGVKPVKGSLVYPDGTEVVGYYIPYSGLQLEALVGLCKALVKTYPQITEDELLTHYWISPHRKNDPFGLDVDLIKELVFQ